MENLIGKDYLPSDNSKLLCLTNSNRVEYLAGTLLGVRPKVCTIVSQPYTENVKYFGSEVKQQFINVIFDGDIFRVIWHPKNVQIDFKEVFKSIKHKAKQAIGMNYKGICRSGVNKGVEVTGEILSVNFTTESALLDTEDYGYVEVSSTTLVFIPPAPILGKRIIYVKPFQSRMNLTCSLYISDGVALI